MKKLWIVLGLLLVVGCQKSISPKQVVEDYFKYVNDDNVEEVNNLFVESDFSLMQEFLNDTKEMKVIEMEILSESEQTAEISVEFDVTYENGKFGPYHDGKNFRTFTLEKIDGDWKIISIGLL